MLISLTFDASTAAAPAAFVPAVGAVKAFFERHYRDPITVNITVSFGSIGGLGSSAFDLLSVADYDTLKSAIAADATTPDDTTAVAHLPATDPIDGAHTYYVTRAAAKALGLLSADAASDGTVTFSNSRTFDYDRSDGISPGSYDFFGVVAHELTEVIGRVLGGTNNAQRGPADGFYPMDLFKYSATGTHSFIGSTAGYFSVDGGATHLNDFNNNLHGDWGDWASNAGNDAFRAFSDSGVANAVSAADLRVMDVIGYDRGVLASRTIDTTADARSDILWRNSDGTVVVWQMNGAKVTSSVVPGGEVPTYWSIVEAHGDYDGDGRSDVLWRNHAGEQNGAGPGRVVTWHMEGAQAGANLIADSLVPLSWSIVNAHADYNGDGRSDVLWRNSDGMVALWQMDGAQLTSDVLAGGPVPLTWSIIDANGDYNGDGKSDVLWRNNEGTVVTWQMDGAQVTSSVLAGGPVPLAWSIVDGHGDYNGDGKSDILWRHQDGTVVIWQMNGAQFTAYALAGGPVPLEWSVVDGHGDYNGDGRSDILWRHGDGTVATWQMNGALLSSAVIGGGPVSLDWNILDGHADYNGDGKSDILWRNSNDGTVVTWQMDGTQVTANVLAGGPVPLAWAIVDAAEAGASMLGDSTGNTLSGTVGRDTLYGKGGNDTLTGGAGADRLVFDTEPNGTENVDTVIGFVSGSDKLVLSDVIYTQLSDGTLPASDFVAEPGAAAHANEHILYDTGMGIVSYDYDGAGPVAAVPFAVLAGHPLLVAEDIEMERI